MHIKLNISSLIIDFCSSYRPPGHKDGHEGSLIRDMCHDMHSLMSLMIASQRDSPQMARFGYWI